MVVVQPRAAVEAALDNPLLIHLYQNRDNFLEAPYNVFTIT
jgi:hypothetical protein